ncbi:hypothetical protein C8J56DRAFT_884535 [Mycena floridula]|nr:hypothetical protein C8J56DRAFT_884535 [Mycena floridula]
MSDASQPPQQTEPPPQQPEQSPDATNNKRPLDSIINTLQAGSSKRAKKGPVGALDPFISAALWIPRFVGLFLNLQDIFTAGLVRDKSWKAQEGAIPETETDEEKEDRLDAEDCAHRAYDAILGLVPNFKSTITDLSAKPELVEELATRMTQTGQQACQQDTNKLKNAIPGFIRSNLAANIPEFPNPSAPSLPFVPKPKAHRGYNNSIYARLLCPYRLLADFDKDPEYPEKMASGAVKVLAEDFLNFMYSHDGKLGQGPILFQAFEQVFMGSVSSFAESKKTRQNISEKHGLKSVAPALIAYTAVQVRFGLSNGSAWDINDGTFSHKQFHQLLVDTLELRSGEAWVKEMLDVWNKRYCGEKTGRGRAGAAGPSEPNPESDAAKLKAARRAQKLTRPIAGLSSIALPCIVACCRCCIFQNGLWQVSISVIPHRAFMYYHEYHRFTATID